mgnify:CR=1 FL=1
MSFKKSVISLDFIFSNKKKQCSLIAVKNGENVLNDIHIYTNNAMIESLIELERKKNSRKMQDNQNHKKQ